MKTLREELDDKSWDNYFNGNISHNTLEKQLEDNYEEDLKYG